MSETDLECSLSAILQQVASGSRHMPLLSKDALRTAAQIDMLCEGLLYMEDLNEIKATIKIIEQAMVAFKAAGAGLVKAVSDMKKHFALSTLTRRKRSLPI